MNQHDQEQRYISVPVVPTEAMMLNGSACQHHAHNDLTCIQRNMRRGIWDKMIAAAPAQPLPTAAGPELQLATEVAQLRQIISEAATACGAAVSAESSIEFMAHLPDEIKSVLARRDVELANLRKLIGAVVREDEDWGGDGDAPGHSHGLPGIWDGDNGRKAGKECAWCKVWAAAVAIARGAGDSENSRPSEKVQAVQETKEHLDLRNRAEYWKQRAKSAEGHLWASDLRAAALELHKYSNYESIPWPDLSESTRLRLYSAAASVIAAVNARRDVRRPREEAIHANEA